MSTTVQEQALPDQFDSLPHAELEAIAARRKWIENAWAHNRRGKQLPPEEGDWNGWLALAGRGFGKTAAMTQWQWWECWRVPGIIGHWVGPTIGDAKGTGFEGPAGFRAVIPAECLHRGSWDQAYRSTNPLQLRLANGSMIRGFGAVREGGRLRGPQCHNLCADELREWDLPAGNLETTLNNALYGLRLRYSDGTPARALFATTPKPIPALKRLMKRPGMLVVRGTSYENLHNLSATFRGQLLAQVGTLMGRQEIDGAFIDEESDQTIIKRGWVKLWPKNKPLPEFQLIVESYDLSSSEEDFNARKQQTDFTACTVWGVFNAAALDEKTRKAIGLRNKLGVLLLEAWQERIGIPELLERAKKQHNVKWGPHPGRKPDVVLIEDKSSGPALRQHLSRWGVPCWPIHPRLDKTQRLHNTAPIFKQAMVFVPESSRPDREGLPRDWCEAVLEQVCSFVGEGSVEHDDLMDTVSQAINYLMQRGTLIATPEEPWADEEERLAAKRRDAEEEQAAHSARAKRNPYL